MFRLAIPVLHVGNSEAASASCCRERDVRDPDGNRIAFVRATGPEPA
jgi:hypothetical protein